MCIRLGNHVARNDGNVRGIKRTDFRRGLLGHDHVASLWIPVEHQAIIESGSAEAVPPQSVVERQLRGYFECVSNEQAQLFGCSLSVYERVQPRAAQGQA